MNAPTWNEWARQQWPGITEDEVSALLWECTSFPLGTIDEVEAQFIAARESSGGDAEKAIWMAHEEGQNG